MNILEASQIAKFPVLLWGYMHDFLFSEHGTGSMQQGISLKVKST